jgi:hypothetical protein
LQFKAFDAVMVCVNQAIAMKLHNAISLRDSAPLSLLLLCFAALPLTPKPAMAQTVPEGFQVLLNGRDLTGWKVPEPNPFWKVSDGVLAGESDEKLKGSMLYTEKTYLNFILEAEARWKGDIDSGFMIRTPELQLQIGVSRSLKVDMTGSFYTGGEEKYPVAGRAKGLEKVLRQGDWNKFRIEAVGKVFKVWLNGEKITEYEDPKYKDAGPIGLQVHPGVAMKIEFRNLILKPL